MSGAAAGATPRLVRLATFNLENLNAPGVFFAGRPGDPPYSDAEYEAKLAWAAGRLDEAGAGLVAFQEVFSDDAVRDLAARAWRALGPGAAVLSPLTEGRRNEAAREGGGGVEATGPHVALATTLPVLGHDLVEAVPEAARLSLAVAGEDGLESAVPLPLARPHRPILRARVRLAEGVAATVLVAHLKSKIGELLEGEDRDDPVARAVGAARSLVLRAAEAAALRALAVEALARGDAVLVMGDLNDGPEAVTTRIAMGDPPRRAREGEPPPPPDTSLRSVHEVARYGPGRDAGRGAVFSHGHDGRRALIDHVLVSRQLHDRHAPDRVGRVRHARVLADHLDAPPPPPGSERRPPTRSDHGLVVAEIEFDAPEPPGSAAG